MFDSIKTIVFGFGGKFKGQKVLTKYFWAFMVALAFTIIILVYCSFMSLNYYDNLLKNLASIDSKGIAYTVTIAVAASIFFLMQALTGTILDYFAQKESKQDIPLFFATGIALLVFLLIDINANLEGVSYVAQDTTTAIADNKAESFTSKIEGTISDRTEKLNLLQSGSMGGYGWADKSGVYHLNGSGKRYQRSLSKEIGQLREQQNKLIEVANTTYKADTDRYKSSVEDKETQHTNLVYFAYVLAFILCVFTQYYSDKAIDFVLAPFSNPTQPAPSTNSNFSQPYGANEHVQGQQIGFTMNKQTSKNNKPTDAQNELSEVKRMLAEMMKKDNAIADTLDKNTLTEILKNELATLNINVSKSSVPNSQDTQFKKGNTVRKDSLNRGSRIEYMESLQKIKVAYKALVSQGNKPTQQAISSLSGLSRNTVGKIMRAHSQEFKNL